MENTPIADDIRRYVLTRVPSVPYMEAILLLREKRDASWEAEQVARRLYLSEGQADLLLQQLREDGVVQLRQGKTNAYFYAPVSGELRELMDRVVQAYNTNLIAISTLIHSRAGGKAKMLADAFVWRKDK